MENMKNNDLTEKAENNREETLLNWLRLINSEDPEEIEMLATKSPEMGKAVELIKKYSADESVRREVEDREKALRDRIALVEDTREVAEAKGKLEGVFETKLKTAKNMLTDGVSVENIAKYTELPVGEITALRGD